MSSIANRPRRSGEHRTSAAARERILDAAFDVICEDGYSGATMAKVAKKAQLPVGSVYWHFENKDLLVATAALARYAQAEVVPEDGTAATVSSWSATSLATAVPSGATTFSNPAAANSAAAADRIRASRSRCRSVR